jgi:hypothetical protein
MIASLFVYHLSPAVVTCVILIAGSRLTTQDAKLPESVRLALVRYTDLGPLAVTWTQTVEATATGREKVAGEVLGKLLGDDPIVQQFAFRDSRIYVRRETNSGSSWPPRTIEIAFDRELLYAAHDLFYAGDLRNRTPQDLPYLHKWLLRNDGPEASYFRDDYFRAVGIRLPTRIKELVPSWHPQSELLALLAEGGRIEAIGPANLDGRPLIRVQAQQRSADGVSIQSLGTRNNAQRRYDFYFDPKRGHAVRRLEVRDEAGRLLTRSDCLEFEQLGQRPFWAPRLCRVEEYTLAGAGTEENVLSDVSASPLYVKKIQVNAFDVRPWPEERFRFKSTTPGVYVNDASFPEIKGTDGVFYQVPANPQRLDEVIAVRRVFHQRWMSAEKRSRPLKVLFLVLNGVGLAALVVSRILRRRRRASGL